MAITKPPKTSKSRPFEIGGETYSFQFQNGELLGAVKQDAAGNFKAPVRLDVSILQSDDAKNTIIKAYNEEKWGSNTDNYVTEFEDIERASEFERNDFFDFNQKKFVNEQKVNPENVESIAVQNASPSNYGNVNNKATEIMSYPSDLNTDQDHFKIMRYNYQRPDLNASKPRQTRYQNDKEAGVKRRINVAGDSVVGSELKGSVLLPMPKVTDVNGVEWGKSELTISGLAALGAVDVLTGQGRLAGKTREEKENDKSIKDQLIEERGRQEKKFQNFGSALYLQSISKIAGFALGTDLDADTYLARSGGQVLNPNAEMLFQGPVIRDFNFSFLMIARSEREGREIRKIIRFLKLGMAPKFKSTTYLKNPDIFTLQYKTGKSESDVLNTVNRFNPGGLALTTMAVDYAPNGYWSAYRDSQPVAVKMDLSFTELRPIYEQDQEETSPNSVGY
tara:strand:- start:681 stop:2027 length:1347 start_codon:yes stop_codon:yes gene_type:complete